MDAREHVAELLALATTPREGLAGPHARAVNIAAQYHAKAILRQLDELQQKISGETTRRMAR